MKAYRKDGNVIIEIPEEDLIFGIEHSPEETMKVTDRDKFLDRVAATLPDFTEQGEGEPDFNKLLDAVAMDAADHDCGVEIVDDEAP